MQKQIKKNQTKRRQQELAVIMALVNGLNMAAPMALAATDVFPVPMVDSSRQMASALNQGVRVLDHLFFSTAHAATTIDSSYDGGNSTQNVNTNDPELYVIENGGTQNVLNSGTVTSATVNNGGAQNVLRGGTASSTVVSGGKMDIVAGSATGTSLVVGEMTVWGSGGPATVTDTVIIGGTMVVKENGKAVDTTVSGGTVNVSGYYNDYNKTTIYGTLENTSVHSGGMVNVNQYGNANNTTVNDGGVMTVNSGGTASATTVNGGTEMTFGGQLDVDGGNVVNTTVSSGGHLHIVTGSATGTVVTGGWMQIDAGGRASDTEFNGGQIFVQGGTVTETVINDGWVGVTSGGNASGTTLNSGILSVAGGAAAAGNVTATTVNGGEMNVSGGNVTSTSVSGGKMNVYGGDVTSTTVNGGSVNVYNGGSVDGVIVNGQQATAGQPWRNDGLWLIGGTASNVTVETGGNLVLRDNASVTGGSLKAGYVLNATTTATLKNLTPDGAGASVPSIEGGVAANITLNNDGLLTVKNGHRASDTTVNSGGNLYIDGGGTAENTVVNGGTVLLADQGRLIGTGTTLNQGAIGLAYGADSASIVDLAITGGGTVDLTYNTYYPDYPDKTITGRNLTIDSLKGNAHFVINTDLTNNKADHITINSGVGNHTVAVAYDPSFEDGTAETVKGEGQFVSAPTGTQFKAVSEAGGYKYLPILSVNGDIWSVTGFTVDGSDSASILAYNAAGAAAGGVSLWRQENNSLTRRLGELRNGGKSGDWARVYKGEIEANAFGRRVKQQYTAIQGGHDTTVSYNGRDWHVGYTLGYLDSNTSMERGGGDASSLSLGGYAAWIGEKGHYLDLIAKVGRLKNKYHSYDVTDQKISGDYHNWGTSLSAEYGYRHALKNNWYLEPQAELTLGRVGSASYRASDGTPVRQDSMTSVVGRFGFAVGRSVGTTNLYAKASLLREFNATAKTNVGGQAMQEELKDNWLEVALGLTGAINDKVNGYLELSRTTGGDKTKTPWQVNVGARWNF